MRKASMMSKNNAMEHITRMAQLVTVTSTVRTAFKCHVCTAVRKMKRVDGSTTKTRASADLYNMGWRFPDGAERVYCPKCAKSKGVL